MTRMRENKKRGGKRIKVEIIRREEGRQGVREVSVVRHICTYFTTSTTKINVQYWIQLASTFCRANSPED